MLQALDSKFKDIDWKSKFKAFAVHIFISLIIFIVLLYLILFEWYPFPFFSTDGGLQGMRLIFFIDMVLGPTLTFVVFRPGKHRLKFDLTVIAIVQFLALGWGVWTVHHEHPVAIVFADDRFYPVPSYLFTEIGVNQTDLLKYDSRIPVRIFVDLPNENNFIARAQFFKNAFQSQTPLFLLQKHYQKIDDTNFKKIIAKSINIEIYLKQDYIKNQNAEWRAIYAQFKAKKMHPDSKFAYIAFYARHGHFIIIIDRKTKEFVDVLNILPPQRTQTEIRVNAEKVINSDTIK